jgi:TPR repeat protein
MLGIMVGLPFVVLAALARYFPSKTRFGRSLGWAWTGVFLAAALLLCAKATFDVHLYEPGGIFPRVFYSGYELDDEGSFEYDADGFVPRTVARLEGDRVTRLHDDLMHGVDDVPLLAARALAAHREEPRAMLALFRGTTLEYVAYRNAAEEALFGDTDVDRALRTIREIVLREGKAKYIHHLGKLCRERHRTKEAAELFTLAAEKGSRGAQNDLGVLFYEGKDGVPKDYAKAAMWFRRAAENDEEADARNGQAAECNLAMIHYRGAGAKRDYAEALKWYTQCARSGNTAAFFMLGEMYRNGLGTKRDYVNAMQWYKRSAEGGNAKAALAVLSMYAAGQGVPKDAEEGKRYLGTLEAKRQLREAWEEARRSSGF